MPGIAAALSGLAGISFSLMLLGAAGTAFSLWSLLRLRYHYRIAEAAERLEAVNFSYVVRHYVRRAQRSHRRAEELLIAKQAIDARRPGWKRWAIISAALTICSAGATGLLVHRNLRATPAVRTATTPLPSVDALAAIQGVWGWRADAQQSCAQNPQTISVSSDRKKLSVHYTKPIANGSDFDFSVVSVQPGTLMLSGPIRTPGPNQPATAVSIRFLDADTYIASNSERPLQTTGVIERCR